MKLSKKQLSSFWQLWSQACRAMRWTAAAGMTAEEIDTKRKVFLLGCGFDSLKDVDQLDGFTKVKNELIVLMGTSLKAGQEACDPTLNQARVLRNQILTEIIPCLEVYRGEKLRDDLTKVMEDKNRWWKIDRPVREMTLMDLDAKPIFRKDRASGELRDFGSQLHQMQWTLSRWLNTLRNAAGDSIHEMRMKASVPCTCAICRGRRAAATVGDDELVAGIAAADPALGSEVPETTEVPF